MGDLRLFVFEWLRGGRGMQELEEVVFEALATLKDREREVLELRFGLLDNKPRTLEEVGKEFGVTRERIRQIEAKALRKLRHPSLRDHLMYFFLTAPYLEGLNEETRARLLEHLVGFKGAWANVERLKSEAERIRNAQNQ